MMTSHSTESNQAHNLVEMRTTESMGKGLFATKDIPRGTQILAEAPVLTIPDTSQFSEEDDDDIAAFCLALHKLAKSEIKRLDELSCSMIHITPERRAKIRTFYEQAPIIDDSGTVVEGGEFQALWNTTLQRFAIFLTNRVQMGFQGKYGTGIFSLFSRINHSCVPNVYNTYKPGSQRLNVYAIRDIQAGEQLTTNYIGSLCRTKEQRQAETVNNWGFVCHCSACADASIEPMRKRMFELDQKLTAYGTLFARDFSDETGVEALECAEELIELLKAQGLVGMELCYTYRDCAKITLELKQMSKTLDYAQKELELERCCIGTETGHLKEDMDGVPSTGSLTFSV